MVRTILLVIPLVGCLGDPEVEVPSCQQAVTHYYEAGCALVNVSTGQPYSAGEVLQSCKESLSSAPAGCQDDLDAVRLCFSSVPSPAKGNADCDCSAEQDALLTCR